MDLTSPRGEERDFFWPVFGDVALAMLLLFLLLLMVQVIESTKLTALERIERRKAEVKEMIRERFPSVHVQDESVVSQRLTFSSDMLFRTCGADSNEMVEDAGPLVRRVGGLLGSVAGYFRGVEVDGHTDERDPIMSDRCPFESNWQLSSARATTVVTLLEQGGFDPRKLSAVGRSEFWPVQSISDTMRASEVLQVYGMNRRIEVLLEYDDSSPSSVGEVAR